MSERPIRLLLGAAGKGQNKAAIPHQPLIRVVLERAAIDSNPADGRAQVQ